MITMTKKPMTVYFAYGSNLSTEQMKQRCPDAKIIGTAIIKGYRLMYKGSKTGAYATIEPERGQEVPVLVWAISDRDEARLDRYEGYPTFYRKEKVRAKITELKNTALIVPGDTITGMVYIMDERREHGIPAVWYEDVLREGYEHFGFNPTVLDEAMVYTAQRVYGF